MKYRKKPIVIEAEQYVHPGKTPDGVCFCDSRAHVHTLEGTLNVSPNDWIITGIKGEKYPCKNDVFQMSYEKVEDENMPKV